ncbi:type IV secretory system conjugative DNA transfer family protein [Spiractinospora alimapuensis]|uniref:type IV secretory system conjugative DNA transfer family protein n=1 Tax=Spiractinospora alimapuensis TaxID=2820884 RepID=UPI001F18282D|nr:TraM recognition domain-containing protein [Spiractinospora alimapuensis]QVQ53443.1 type IV secretory system conjugative DNA transfer family protein [Spiractinospora alimapuensis]
MARKFQPRGSASAGAASPLLLLVALWGVVAVFGVVWAAGWLAAAITDGEVSDFGVEWAIALVTADFDATWSGAPTWLVFALASVMLVALFFVIRFVMRLFGAFRPPDGDIVSSLNGKNESIGELSRPQAADKAVRLRKRTLAGRKGKSLSDDDTGLLLGKVKQYRGANGPSLFASWEDTILAYMAPRAGKTTALAIPYVLSAPGPALATSNKGDVWAATARIREQMTGERVWLFDPQRITHQPQLFWWNPLARVKSVEDANRLAGHFVLTIDDDSKKDMWGPAAKALLSQLILAAALDDASLNRVGEWLHDAKQPRPVEVLFDHGYDAYAESLRETQNIVSETRDGIYTTARTAARCLDDPEIMAWVNPPGTPAIDQFDVTAFVTSNQTLHLLSKSRSSAAPLIAAMTDAVFLAGEEASEGQGGRLDPPLVAVLDEAANICKIADLPDMYSHLGSRGIIPVTILQSYRQGVRVWTENGMEAMWSAATVKMFGAGLDDHKIVEALSKLIGQHDVSTGSFSYGDGKGNHSVQLRRQEIMQGSDIRNIAKGDALLFATAAPAMLLKMAPWYEGEHVKRVSAAIAASEELVTAGARERYGPVLENAPLEGDSEQESKP